MAEQSSMHWYLNWAKQRIDEMDATLASFEVQAAKAKADSKVQADQLIAELKKQRDQFQANAKTQAEAGEAALKAGKAQLETQWRGFEAQVKAYFDTLGKQVEQQKLTFLDVAAAQVKAWREAAETFQSEAGKISAARRAHVDRAIKQMKADAAEAEARFQKLKQAGTETWSALSSALAESRKAFDRANQQAGEAIERSAPADAT